MLARIKLNKGEFIGRDQLLKQKEKGLSRARIGLRMREKGIPREGHKILADGKEVGHVTSGTLSPLFNVGIAMGYAPPEIKNAKSIAVEIRGKPRAAELAQMPFYDPAKFGFGRKKSG